MKIGEIMPLEREIVLNEGKPSLTVLVANTGDRPVQVGSHFHFFEVNKCLSFDREKTYGYHLDIPSGTSVRFEPGEEKEVQDFVKQGGTADVFMEKLYDMLEFLLPNYILEGKNQLVIAIGCTGGKHRSVTIARTLYEKLLSHPEYGIKLFHRDIENDNKRKGL